jgi:hypothetical protein
MNDLRGLARRERHSRILDQRIRPSVFRKPPYVMEFAKKCDGVQGSISMANRTVTGPRTTNRYEDFRLVR